MTRTLSLSPTIAAVVFACMLSAGTARAQTPTRVRGTIDHLSGDVLVVTTKGGDSVSVTLTDPVRVVAEFKASVSDIKPGSSVGIASLPGPDGALRAVGVIVLPPGQSITPVNGPWDLTPSSRMTNGSVGTVVLQNGRVLTVNYGTGEQKIMVPDDVPVVTPKPGERTMLTPGAHVVVFARKADDGKLSAATVAVGEDGAVPPM